MKFVFLRPRFAARFLQISRHREHPCVKLTATSVFTARDSHPIDYAHAGRTKTSFPLLREGCFRVPGYNKRTNMALKKVVPDYAMLLFLGILCGTIIIASHRKRVVSFP